MVLPKKCAVKFEASWLLLFYFCGCMFSAKRDSYHSMGKLSIRKWMINLSAFGVSYRLDDTNGFMLRFNEKGKL